MNTRQKGRRVETRPTQEEQARAEGDAAAGQRREVLQEGSVRTRFLVQQVAAVDEQFPRVAAAGATNLLVQRANPAWGYGHCAIPASAQVQAITDLATWAATGIKPNN